MKKSLFGLALLVIAVAVCVACSVYVNPTVSRGFDIRTANIKYITKGQTTEKEVIEMFGPPAKYRDTKDGKEFLYDYAKAGGEIYVGTIPIGGGTKQKTLLIRFDKKGVVTSYVYKES